MKSKRLKRPGGQRRRKEYPEKYVGFPERNDASFPAEATAEQGTRNEETKLKITLNPDH